MRKLGLAILAITAACARLSDDPGIPAAAGDLLLLSSPDGLVAVDAASGISALQVPGGVPAPDGSELVAARPAPGGTTLATYDPASGEARHVLRLDDRDLALGAVSSSGELVALASPPAGAGPWLAAPRARTRIVIARPAGGPVERFDLPGNFVPEAFSPNGRLLYVVEFVPALAPESYRVRAVELRSGDVLPVFGPNKDPSPEMRGTGRVHAFAPDGTRLYTLYTRQPEPGHGSVSTGVFAFVHVLSLADGWAHCVDLPPPLASAGGALAVSSDRMFVVDPARGSVAVVDADRLALRGVVEGLFPAARQAAAAVGPGGTLYVAAGSRVLALRGDRLRTRWSAELDGAASGIEVSPDGDRVYVLAGGRLEGLDAATGRPLGSIPALGMTAMETVSTLG